MEGWAFGLHLDPLSGLQETLAALAWTARIQSSGLASPLPAASAPSDSRAHIERLSEERKAGEQSVSASEAVPNGTGELAMQTRDPTPVRENGLHPVEPPNDLGKDCMLRTMFLGQNWVLLSLPEGYARPPLP